MKNKIFLILLAIYVQISFGQQLKTIDKSSKDFISDGNLQNSLTRDSILGVFTEKGTQKNKNINAKIDDYKIISKNYDTTYVDTTLNIKKYYKINFLRNDDLEVLPFSNTAVAYNQLVFSPDFSITPKMGASNKYLMYQGDKDVEYYFVPTPFTELMYRSVFEQGQLLDALYTVNTSRQFNFSISRKGLRSLGNYQNFLSNSSNFLFTTNYHSKNKKYFLRSHYSNQKLFSEQNGGISNSDIENFQSGDNQFLDRGVFDPIFEDARNEFLSKRFYIDQMYKFSEKDSLSNKTLEIYNSLNFEKKEYLFKQTSANVYFGESFANQLVADKIFLNTLDIETRLNYNSNKIGNIGVGLIYRGDKYFSENYNIQDYTDNSEILDLKTTYLVLNYRKKIKNNHIEFKTVNSVLGDNNSHSFFAKASIDLKKGSSLTFNYQLSSSIPDYNYILYNSNYLNYNWNNRFNNILSSSIIADLKIKKLVNIKANLISVRNHLQFEKISSLDENNDLIYSVQPIQHSGKLDLININLHNRLSLGKFTFDSNILFQKSISEDIVNVPELLTRNTFFFSTEMFNKALFLQTGFGIKFFTKYFMNAYDPLLSELYIQKDILIGEYPLIDFFINTKIQQTRLYFKFEHINSSITGYNYYSAPNYPYRDFTFRFGLVWNFFQ